MANDPNMQGLSSILSSMRLETDDQKRVGKISILKRPTAAPSSDTNASASEASAPASSEKTSPATDNSTPPTQPTKSDEAAAASSSGAAAAASTESPSADQDSTIDPDSNQNRRRKETLKKEMNWRKKCEQMGGDFSDNRDWGLMEAEWLRSIPEDFEKKWQVIPCPVGKRCSLWALDGETHAYTKQGIFLESFESALPNGHQYSGCNGSTFLDGVYCENLSTYFILDALQWNNYDLRRGSAEFRLFHLNAQMADYLDSGDIHPRYRATFKNFVMQLPLFPCTPKGVMRALAWSPLPNLRMELDGILFYHHDAMYTSGTTPLVAWIKPWMAEEVFSNVKIPPHLLMRKPNHYRNRQTFMKEWDDKEARKRAKGGEKVGRKAFQRGPVPLMTSRVPPKSADAGANNDDDDEEEDVEANRALPPLNDDPDLALAAQDAQKSDNSLLALVGENILDTFGAVLTPTSPKTTATAAAPSTTTPVTTSQ